MPRLERSIGSEGYGLQNGIRAAGDWLEQPRLGSRGTPSVADQFFAAARNSASPQFPAFSFTRRARRIPAAATNPRARLLRTDQRRLSLHSLSTRLSYRALRRD